jgi:hypothetical protein
MRWRLAEVITADGVVELIWAGIAVGRYRGNCVAR